MRSASGGPRVLLRRLREVMAEPVSAQDRLNKIVVLIAANMVAEVCSLYVLRVDGTLELYATEGLKPESVHVTVLRQDEGLVGLVASDAKSLNLSDAQHHPAFAFRPETGEVLWANRYDRGAGDTLSVQDEIVDYGLAIYGFKHLRTITQSGTLISLNDAFISLQLFHAAMAPFPHASSIANQEL